MAKPFIIQVGSADVKAALDRIEQKLTLMENRIMATMADLQAVVDDLTVKVQNETTVVGSAITLLQQLKAALDAALAQSSPDAVIAAVTAVRDKIGADTQTLADAVTANTPAGGGPVGPV